MANKTTQQRLIEEANDPNWLKNTLNQVERAERASARTRRQRESRDTFGEIANILRQRGQ